MISPNFPAVGDYTPGTHKGAVNEVQDGFLSGSAMVYQQSSQGPGRQGLVQGAPSPNSLPVCFASGIPLGMTSLGSRTPVMEGWSQVGSGVEPGALQRVEPRAPPDSVNPIPMVTKSNSDRVPTVRATPPPVATKAKDAPQNLHHLSPSPLSLPPGPPDSHRGVGVDPGGDVNLQVQSLYQGNPQNSQGSHKDIKTQGNLGQDAVQVQDLGSTGRTSSRTTTHEYGHRWAADCTRSRASSRPVNVKLNLHRYKGIS